MPDAPLLPGTYASIAIISSRGTGRGLCADMIDNAPMSWRPLRRRGRNEPRGARAAPAPPHRARARVAQGPAARRGVQRAGAFNQQREAHAVGCIADDLSP